MYVLKIQIRTVIFCEPDTQVYENKNANPEEEMVFCYQSCSELLWEEIVLEIKKKF